MKSLVQHELVHIFLQNLKRLQIRLIEKFWLQTLTPTQSEATYNHLNVKLFSRKQF